ncbi:sugar ABC transporter permease [Lachnoclostridium sp. An169]|uniref:ABC transporter permease n=1 Tax=Lachnoclostridium sp. An169 TaxID=1965569 RepID=UPI000B374FFD|nr:ABC transporter permease subunit [Lachnoclostridium sp. An169]OUP85476.1 sugar ABC transporter permease [Lachnoclostridium sp. An169]
MKTKRKSNKIVRCLPFYVMALPGIAYLICNNFMPLYGMLLAFKKLDVRKGIFGSEWVGLKNFEFLFSSNTAFKIIRNTIGYNLVFLIVGTAIAVALAILLNEVRLKGFKKFYQSMLLIPYLISWVLASYLAYAFLAQDVGLINSILNFFGLPDVAWYTSKQYWPVILFIVYIWKNVGYMLIIYYSSIVSISADYFEAATIDGATKWQQIRFITLPLIKSTVVTMTILMLGRIANSDFGLFYQIPRNSGALYDTTQTIDVYVYNALMNNNDFGMSAAAAVFQSVVGFIFIMAANGVVRKISKRDALF